MPATSSILNTAPALDRKIRESVRGTLGWDATTYKRYRSNMSSSQHEQLIDYGRVCAEMARRYKHWSSNLMLEWRGTEKKSVYISPYAQEQAPQGVQKLAKYRFAYLDLLYEHLPLTERKVFGELLSPCYLATGCMPDIKASYVLYKLQDVLMQTRAFLYHQRGARQLSLPVAGIELTDETRRYVDLVLASFLESPAENNDSLFAQLLLNTAINRCLLELAEHSRLDRQAAKGMEALVRHLQQRYPDHRLPLVHNVDDVRNTVASAMDLCAPGYDWREFKGHALDNVLLRAQAVADADQTTPQFSDETPHRLLLTALAVAWSYCTREKHDSRLVQDNRRKRDVIDGRSREDARTYQPNLRFYHERQLKLLWFSRQMDLLRAERIAQQHAVSQHFREIFQAYLCRFKGLTLMQWAKLDWELSDLLRGSPWDKEEPLVAEASQRTVR